MKQRYEKPSMQKINLRNNTSVADVCWAYANKPEDPGNHYYIEFDNTEWGGRGTWIGFSVAGGAQNCKSASGLQYKIVEYGENTDHQAALEVLQAKLDSFENTANGASNFGFSELGFRKDPPTPSW